MRLHGQTERDLERVAQASLGGHPYQAHVAHEELAAALLHYARQDEVELIAMAIPSSPEDARAAGGHASLTVLHHADVPVLLIPDAVADVVEEPPDARRGMGRRASVSRRTR